MTDLCTCGHERAAHETDDCEPRPECSARVAAGEVDGHPEHPCGCAGFVAAPAPRVRFGGSDEVGPACACGRRVDATWKACPWCGMRLDDVATLLAAYLDGLADQAERSASTKESRGDRYPGESRKRTAARLRATAAEHRRRAAWVRGAREALATWIALDGSDSPPAKWEAALAAARALFGGRT